ncbi:hypothetical protein Tco_0546493, partial [Tanacetum coccineum]
TSKSDLLTEPTLNPQHIDEFDLKDETSLSEYNEEEQNVLNFNDLFPFNIIQPKDLKSEKDNDDNEVDIIQSSGDMALPPRDQRHQYLSYEGLQYTDADIEDFEMRLARIYRRELHRVHVFDFGGLPDLMAEGLSARMPKEFGEAVLDLDTPRALQFQLGGARPRLSWRQFILALGLHTAEEMETVGFGAYWAESARQIPHKGDPILRLCHRLIAFSIIGRSQETKKVLEVVFARRKSRTLIYGGQFVARLAEQFGLLTEERIQGLTIIAPELQVIDMAKLVRLHICVEIDDTWAWVALGLERQPDVAAGALEAAEDAPIVDEGGQAVPAPVQAPPPPPATARTMPQRMARLEEDVHEIRRALAEQREVIGAMARDFSRFTVWAASGIAHLLDSARVTYMPYSETRIPYQHRVRHRTGEASTSTAQ